MEDRKKSIKFEGKNDVPGEEKGSLNNNTNANINTYDENTVENDFKTQKLVDLGMQSREMIPNTGSMELILFEN